MKLEDLATGHIYTHEATLPKQKADRLRLLRACRANLSPVFALYPEEESNTEEFLKSITSSPPEIDFQWNAGLRNRLWVIKDWMTIEKVSKLLEPKPLFIADGHHRYEVALTYRNELEDLSPQCPANYALIALVSMSDPGLHILPIHRVIRVPPGPGPSVEELLEESFDIEDLAEGSQYRHLAKRLEEGPEHTFGLFVGSPRGYYLLTLRDNKLLQRALSQDPQCLRELDVRILHGLAIDKILGKTSGEENHIKYVHDAQEAVHLVEEGDYDMAFFLNPTKMEEVSEVASSRLKMPPKSTFFYPKLLSGLVINPL